MVRKRVVGKRVLLVGGGDAGKTQASGEVGNALFVDLGGFHKGTSFMFFHYIGGTFTFYILSVCV